MKDEYHFLLVCKAYANLRKERLPKTYICQPNYNKCNVLMASENYLIVKSSALFLCSAFKLRKELLSMYGT